MTPKERAAMQQALEALEKDLNLTEEERIATITALREALKPKQCRSDGRCQYAIDHGAEGLGHCPSGKCCMPAEPAEQEPSIDFDKLHEMNMQYVDCPACGSDMAMAYSPKKQAEQEPVGVVAPNGGISWRIGQEPLPPRTRLYAAPVRTKDLTDDEIWDLWESNKNETAIEFYEAIIAAYKEKNK